MSTLQIEPLLEAAERRAVLAVLRRHPEWTLGQVFAHLEQNGERAAVLRELTFGELFDERCIDPLATGNDDGDPPIDRRRLETAKRLTGPDFDACVRDVIAEAVRTSVGASYLRARVGGPRWKLQASLRRLVDAGVIKRSGSTSGTRYWVAEK